MFIKNSWFANNLNHEFHTVFVTQKKFLLICLIYLQRIRYIFLVLIYTILSLILLHRLTMQTLGVSTWRHSTTSDFFIFFVALFTNANILFKNSQLYVKADVFIYIFTQFRLDIDNTSKYFKIIKYHYLESIKNKK